MLFRALILLLIFTFPAHAQQSKQIGRLSDGRAFRIDQSGMRLIDQVAELEVNNDELKRQVISLEDEVKQQKGIIESLRAGVKVASDDKLREQDLLGKTSSGLPKAATAVQSNNSGCSVQAVKQDCSSELASLKTQNDAKLEQEISRYRDKIALLEAEKSQLHGQLKAPEAERANLVSRLSKLEQEKNQLLEENQSLKSNLASNSKELFDKQKTLAEKDKAISQTKEEKERLAQQSKAELELAMAAEEEQNQKLKLELASLKEQLIETQKEALKAQESRTILRADVRPVETVPVVRSEPSLEAKNLLSQIQSKIMKRKSLLDNVSKSGKGISLSATSLVTSNGLSLDRLRQLVTVDEAAGIKGLREIEKILDTDIATASRLAK